MIRKISIVVIALAILGMFAPKANAMTTEEMLALIEQLQSQILALQQQLGGTGAGTSGCTITSFTNDLSQGSEGQAVKCLQIILNSSADTKVAETGAGSPGSETTYFGPLTHAAALKFQTKYNISPVAGYVGPITRAKLNTMFGTIPTTPTDPTTPTTPADGAEGTLTSKVYATPANNTEVPWGSENKGVMAIELKAKDSEIKVNRIDLTLNQNNPWQWVNYISLWDGSNVLKGMVVNSVNAEEFVSGSNRKMRFSGLDITVPKDSTKVVTVAVNTDYYPRERGVGSPIIIGASSSAIRGTDSIGLTQYNTNVGDVTRSFYNAGDALTGRIEVKSNPSNPEETVLVPDEFTTTEHEVLKFDVKITRDNVKITQVKFDVTGTITNVPTLNFYDGTTLIGSETLVATTTFSNLSWEIAKDVTKTVTVKAVHAATTTTGSIGVSFDSNWITAEGASGETVTKTGSVTGNTHAFYGVAPALAMTAKSITVQTASTSIASAYIEFDVTAIGGDVYIATGTATTRGTSTASSTTPNKITNMDTVETLGGCYVVREGVTKKFRIEGTLNHAAGGESGYHYFYFDKMSWGPTSGTANSWTSADFLKTLKTASVYLDN